MKQHIDEIIIKTKIDRNLPKNDLIKFIENLYDQAIIYIESNASTVKEVKSFTQYAHVIFSQRLLQYVSVDDYVAYIQMKTQIQMINNSVTELREPMKNKTYGLNQPKR